MGQAAEDLEHLEWCRSMPKSEVNPHGYEVEPEWTMRDGTKIKISKMETSHIKNCIRLLERRQVEEKNRALEHNIRIFKKELLRREKAGEIK